MAITPNAALSRSQILPRDEKEAQTNYKPYILVIYAIEHLASTDKVRFYYGLKGRDGKSGIVKEWGLRHLARGALLVPASSHEQTLNFLQEWQCKYATKEVLVKG